MKKKPDTNTPDLFAEPKTRKARARAAREGRDVGMAQAVDHADAVDPSWSDVAMEYVKVFARRGCEFMGEDVRTYAQERGMPEPPDRRAWGAVLVRAAKRGLIKRLRYEPCKDPRSHASPSAVWVGA